MSVFVRASTGPSSQSRWFERILPEKCVLFGNAFIQVCLILDSPSSVVFAIVEAGDIPAELKTNTCTRDPFAGVPGEFNCLKSHVAHSG
jgi:hypothetical protein